MIKNNVTFEQAKWLKEKGFDVDCKSKFLRGEIEYSGIHNPFFAEPKEDIVERPEQWQVVEWLRINHGIWISVGNVYSEYTHWAYGIGKENKGMILPFREGQDNHDYFNSPQEAYSAAFDYIKDNNLI
jgi:hypothetical protein